MQQELAEQGDHHGCKRIARLLKAAGLRGRCARRFVPCTTQSDHDQPIAPNLLAQRPAPTGPAAAPSATAVRPRSAPDSRSA